MRTCLILGCMLFANAIIADPPKSDATIHRVVETREGHKSCWGVAISLKKLSFKKSIATNELSIIEAKHSHNLNDIMVWRVDKSRKKLVIEFKQGRGDFGSGNSVEVTIKASAFSGIQKEDITLSISTDP